MTDRYLIIKVPYTQTQQVYVFIVHFPDYFAHCVNLMGLAYIFLKVYKRISIFQSQKHIL